MNYDLAILILRVAIGLTVAAHGAQKLFGWFGGSGFSGAIAMASKMRLRPVRWWALMAGLTEFGGGVLLALGFLHPLGPLGVAAAMLSAVLLAHWPRFFSSNRGMEYPLVLLAGALALGLMGAGSYSLDALIGLALPEPVSFLTGLVLVVVGQTVALVTRSPEPAAAPAPSTKQAAG